MILVYPVGIPALYFALVYLSREDVNPDPLRVLEDCVEGMCSAAAVAKRCGVAVSELSNVADDDDAWDATAHYVAGLCANLILTTSPQARSISHWSPYDRVGVVNADP